MERAGIDLQYQYYEWACFTSQQAAEKAVKAVYQRLNKSVRGHSVVKMLEGLKDDLTISQELLHMAMILDRYYIEGRYPNGFPEGSPMDFFDEKIGKEAEHAARQIVGFCEDTLDRL